MGQIQLNNVCFLPGFVAFKNPLEILVQFSIVLCTFFICEYVIMDNLKFYEEFYAYFSIYICSVIYLANSLNIHMQDTMYLNIFKAGIRVRDLCYHAFVWISHSSLRII